MKQKLAKVIPLGLCVLIASILIIISSINPGETLYYFFPGVFTNSLYFGNFINYAVLLCLSGLGIIIAFDSGAFNLGGEGQVYAGGIVALSFALSFPNLPGYIALPIMLILGTIGGGLIALISGFFKFLWQIDELISTFLISAGVSRIIDYLISGPLYDEGSYLMTTPSIPQNYELKSILAPSHLNGSLFIVLILVLIFHFYLNHSRSGYELRLMGANREFARYGGLNTGLYETMPLALSGALHGLCGAIALAGTYHAGIVGFTGGLGWNGIAVALIASRKTSLLIPGALFFAWMTQGAELATLQSGLSLELGSIIQGILFLLISAEFFKERFRG